MKALTVRQPWASLIVRGVKQIETRSWRLPDKMIGARIAIHAGAHVPTKVEMEAFNAARQDPSYQLWRDRDGTHLMYPTRNIFADSTLLPLGAIVGHVTLGESLPIVDEDGITYDEDGMIERDLERSIIVDRSGAWTRTGEPGLHLLGGDLFGIGGHDITDQEPYGDYTPGRYGWLLADTKPCDPTPAKGRLGFWEVDQ